MPVLLAILAAFGAAAFWYHRLRDPGQAGGDAIGAAQRARGVDITAIDDPVIGAVVMMVAICRERGPLTPATEAGILHEMQTVMGVEKISTPYARAKRAAERVADASDAGRRLSTLWMEKLDHHERADLLAMVSRVVALDGPPTPVQEAVLRKLEETLALT